MANSPLKESQLAMARYLRDPGGQPAPEGVEPRRLKIYEDLIYNNIEGFISSGFPVLRSLYSDADWHCMVRLFIDQHRCHTPYFLEISQEFLSYLNGVHEQRDCDPVFMAELAHYEWVELGLDISLQELPPAAAYTDLLSAVPRLSNLAWSLTYQFPVHRVGARFRPAEAAEPTFLVVYRNREDKVLFMEINSGIARLLELVRDNFEDMPGDDIRTLLNALAVELNMALEAMLGFGKDQFEQLIAADIVLI